MKDFVICETGIFLEYEEPICDDYFNVIYRDVDNAVKALTPQTNLIDLLYLGDLLNKVNGKEFLEVGAWVGHTTCFIGLFAKMKEGKLITIDNFMGNEGALNFHIPINAKDLLLKNIRKHKLEDVVTIVEGDSRCVSRNFDFIFLDACHTYTEFKKDLEYWWPRVNPGGILAGHDFNADEYDERYIEDDFVDGKHHGVIKAVKEIFKDKFLVSGHGSSIWHIKK